MVTATRKGWLPTPPREIWVHEHGPQGGDEINQIQKERIMGGL